MGPASTPSTRTGPYLLRTIPETITSESGAFYHPLLQTKSVIPKTLGRTPQTHVKLYPTDHGPSTHSIHSEAKQPFRTYLSLSKTPAETHQNVVAQNLHTDLRVAKTTKHQKDFRKTANSAEPRIQKGVYRSVGLTKTWQRKPATIHFVSRRPRKPASCQCTWHPENFLSKRSRHTSCPHL